MLDAAFDGLFDLTPAIRYVAFGSGQEVVMREREGLGGASSSDSDRYEELLVNPTLLTLARQRGEMTSCRWLAGTRRSRSSSTATRSDTFPPVAEILRDLD